MEIILKVTKTKLEDRPYMLEVYVDQCWFKEMGPFSDPALAFSEAVANDDLQEIMRPDRKTK
jgi:hypothetical protein